MKLSRLEKFLVWLYIVSVIAAAYWCGHLLMRHFGVVVAILCDAAIGAMAGFLLGFWLRWRFRNR